MLAVDWLGCVLTAGLLALLLTGRRRPVRALVAMLLGETGRTGAVLALAGQLDAVTVGGAFTRLTTGEAPGTLFQLAGLVGAALLGYVIHPTVARDTFRYAVLAMCVTGAMFL